MANIHVLMGRSKPAAATPTTLYTSPVSTKTQWYSLSVCNSGNSDDSITVWLVPSGGAAADNNMIIGKTMVVDFGDPYGYNIPQIIEPGDFIVVQSTNGNCTFTASGLQIT